MISSSASLLHCIVFVIIALAWTGSDTSVAGSPMELVSGDQVARKARVGEEIVSTYKVEDLPRFDAENFRLQAQEAFKIGKKVLVVMDVSVSISIQLMSVYSNIDIIFLTPRELYVNAEPILQKQLN